MTQFDMCGHILSVNVKRGSSVVECRTRNQSAWKHFFNPRREYTEGSVNLCADKLIYKYVCLMDKQYFWRKKKVDTWR